MLQHTIIVIPAKAGIQNPLPGMMAALSGFRIKYGMTGMQSSLLSLYRCHTEPIKE
jgi:hypothetical protein